MSAQNQIAGTNWKKGEIIIFRILFIYFILQAFPLDWKYYRNLFAINWSELHYRDVFYLSRYTPQFVSGNGNTLTWGLNTIADWLVILAIAIIGALVWGYLERDKDARQRERYNRLYYILRSILRYRLAIALLAYGFIKIYPMQQPYPSLSLLNTNYGDFTDWKVASFSYGVAPSFEALLGWVEMLSAALLLHRKTASIGAAIAIGYVGNVFLSNLAYSGGEAVYCLLLLSFASVILFYDASRWYKLIVLAKPTLPNIYRPRLSRNLLVVKVVSIVVIVGAFWFLASNTFKDNGYQYPRTTGLPNSAGLYNVREFKLNGEAIPYSLTDAHRWQNVVFEKWNTISIRSNTNEQAGLHNTEDIYVNDTDRDYESQGSSGRHFYSYTVDSLKHQLLLRNKNPRSKNDVLVLNYTKAGSGQLVLQGKDAKGNNVYAVLEKINKTYILNESFKIPQNRSAFE